MPEYTLQEIEALRMRRVYAEADAREKEAEAANRRAAEGHKAQTDQKAVEVTKRKQVLAGRSRRAPHDWLERLKAALTQGLPLVAACTHAGCKESTARQHAGAYKHLLPPCSCGREALHKGPCRGMSQEVRRTRRRATVGSPAPNPTSFVQAEIKRLNAEVERLNKLLSPPPEARQS